jgi:hypothetical protein
MGVCGGAEWLAPLVCLCLRTCPIPPLPSLWTRARLSSDRDKSLVIALYCIVRPVLRIAYRTSDLRIVVWGGLKGRKSEGGLGFDTLGYFIITVSDR